MRRATTTTDFATRLTLTAVMVWYYAGALSLDEEGYITQHEDQPA